MLKTRILTALIMLPILLAAIWWLPPLWFGFFMAAVVAVAAWEWAQLVGFTQRVSKMIYVFLIMLGLVLVNFIPTLLMLIVGAIFCVWLLLAIVFYQKMNNPLGWEMPLVRAIGGLFLLLPFWVGCVLLKVDPNYGAGWILYLLLIIATTDTAAYFIGRYCGKSKLATQVSPNKTWAGFWGGLLVASIVGIAVSHFIVLPFEQRAILWGLVILASLASVVGDLSISLCKRLVGVKDTGKIFPGHGGMLDRIDAMIVATIIFVLGLLVL